MKNKWHKNKHFWSGLCIGIVIASILYSQGVFADSLSPRKNAIGFTPPTHDPNGADQTAPVIHFVYPTAGTVVDSTMLNSLNGPYNTYIVPIGYRASDNDKIVFVNIYVNDVIDSVMYYNDNVYETTARLPIQSGTYTIKAVAYDANGNSSYSTTSVVVPPKGKSDKK